MHNYKEKERGCERRINVSKWNNNEEHGFNNINYIDVIQYTKYQKLIVTFAALTWYIPLLSLDVHSDYVVYHD